MPRGADDQVVVHRDAQPLARLRDGAGDVDIGAAGRGVAAGMVVRHASGLSKLLILCHYSGSWEMMVPRIGIGCSCPIMIITPDHRSVRRVVWKHGTALYSYRPIHQARRWDRAPPYQL